MTKYGLYLREMIMMQNETTINIFGNPNMIKERQKSEMLMNLLTNERSKTVYEVIEITESGQTEFHPEMIANV